MSLEERGYEVRGGVAGTYAVTEDMRHAADALARARALVDGADAAIRRQIALSETVGDATVPEAAGAWFSADGALRRVLWGSGGTVAMADDIAVQSAQLQRAADIYVEAESQVGRELSLLDRIGRGVMDTVGTGLWVARSVTAGALSLLLPPDDIQARSDSVLGDMYLMGHAVMMPDGAPPTTGYLNRDGVELWLGMLRGVGLGEDSVSAYDAALMQLMMATALLSALAGPTPSGAVVPRVDPRCLPAPRGLEGLFTGLRATHADHDGAVGIQTLTQTDGTEAFIVNVPGTQDWSLAADNPFNAQGNLEAMAGQSALAPTTDPTDAARHTVAAMRAADIPPNSPVMMVGYSQGGMVATTVAAAAARGSEFNVTHVATAGSPLQPFQRSAQVQHLHIEHHEDITSGVEGGANPDRPHVTTVTADARSSTDPKVALEATTLTGAHQLSTFADTASMVDAHPSASVEHYLDSATAFLGDAETTRYVEYVPAPPESPPVRTGGGGGW